VDNPSEGEKMKLEKIKKTDEPIEDKGMMIEKKTELPVQEKVQKEFEEVPKKRLNKEESLGERLRKITAAKVEKLKNQLMDEAVKQAEEQYLKAEIQLKDNEIELFCERVKEEIEKENVEVSFKDGVVTISW